MKRFLIIGLSGTGKTSVGNVLRNRGKHVINADDHISSYQNIATGKLVDTPRVYPDKVWLEQHAWVWDASKLKQALDAVNQTEVFVCGGAVNESSFYDWFDIVFGLCVSDTDITIRRLQAREPERWQANSPALKIQLKRHVTELQRLKAAHAIVIDASQPIEETADKILSLSRN